MEYQVVLLEAEEGGFVVSCPALPGCISQGETKKEAIANIREAIECYLESMELDEVATQKQVNAEIISVRV